MVSVLPGLAKITEGESWGKQAEALCVAKAAGSKAERERERENEPNNTTVEQAAGLRC